MILGICIGMAVTVCVYELFDIYKRNRVPVFDRIETHENCTVQILTNSETGEVDIGWWRGGKDDVPVIKDARGV